MNIRVAIADDEPLARERLVRLVNKEPSLQLVAVCEHGQQALSTINEQKPDLVFLDIQMPGLSGFDVITNINTEPKPWIIFVTAYDRYAIQAFEFHALDYLLKPFKDSRFEEAVMRALKQISLEQHSSHQKHLANLIDDKSAFKTNKLHDVFIEVKVQGRTKHINSQDILWIGSDGNYVTLYTTSGEYLYRSTISSLEYDLAEAGFFRIHRSILFNINALENVLYLHANNQYKLILHDRTELISARSYKERMAQFLDNHPQFSR